MATTFPVNPLKLVGLVNRAFARIVDAPLRELGIATGQVPVLVALKQHGALPQAELARIARVEQPSMAQLLARMERDGLVRRTPDPTDGRSRLITLTDSAAKQLPKGRAVMEAVSEQALAGLSAKERDQLGALLARVLANLEAVGQPEQASGHPG
jgi:MarR family transcriptional regulator, transcriptional regulator for hemolysin